MSTRLVRWWVTRCLNLAHVRRPPVSVRGVARALARGRLEKISIEPSPLPTGRPGKLTVLRGGRGLEARILYDEWFEAPRIRHVVAHELWHLIRTLSLVRQGGGHAPIRETRRAREEAEADLFARLLLMPERLLQGLLPEPSSRLENLSRLHEIAARFVVPVAIAEARMRELLGRGWKALPPSLFLPEDELTGRLRRSRDTYRIRLVDHRGEVTVLEGLSSRTLLSRIEMTVTWSGVGPRKGRPPRSALPAVVAISNERRRSESWYYEGVGIAGVLDLRREWGGRLVTG